MWKEAMQVDVTIALLWFKIKTSIGYIPFHLELVFLGVGTVSYLLKNGY